MKKIIKFKISFFLFLLSFFQNISAQTEPQPLRIAVTGFTPPFVMQSAQNQFYGFDIALTTYVCSKLNRPCEYITMDFNQLISTIVANKADLAASAVTITPERSKLVRFSIPYMISEAQFVGLREKSASEFHIDKLANTKIGIVSGSIFAREIEQMDINNVHVVSFKRNDDLIEAMNLGALDYALMDAATARYWENNSSGKIQALGKPFSVGFGLALLTNNANNDLIQQVNLALMNYQNSDEFKRNYDMYLNNF